MASLCTMDLEFSPFWMKSCIRSALLLKAFLAFDWTFVVVFESCATSFRRTASQESMNFIASFNASSNAGTYIKSFEVFVLSTMIVRSSCNLYMDIFHHSNTTLPSWMQRRNLSLTGICLMRSVIICRLFFL